MILKQLVDDGISKYMQKLGIGYANYFNTKYKRCGSLFQGRFNAKHIDSEEYFIWGSCYVNRNPKKHRKYIDLNTYPWTSYLEYIGESNNKICNKEVIMCNFSVNDYKIMVEKASEDGGSRNLPA